MTIRLTPVLLLLVCLASAVVITACDAESEQDAPDEPEGLSEAQEAFWDRLEALCGQAFEGEGVQAPEGDTTFDDPLVMHVRECYDDEIRIPLHVGENRSRTWIVSQTDTGLRLKHDHRYEDGTEEEMTQYGGDTQDPGEPGRQDFHVDDYTIELNPETATNIWTIEVDDEQFAYALDRVGTERQFRMEFDLTEPVDPPPAPWGHEDTEPTHPANDG